MIKEIPGSVEKGNDMINRLENNDKLPEYPV